ncbi:MAG: glutamate--tRNA ligase [Gammaproteobacteria bacterium]|nr:glutamate--tRNA ligase [Gammaproteobacteria bacterium]NIR96959.1 glutamate--tRNA ligase [Gammaproteobacteria bacterium]NIT62661.1 glutamate--tRNA ligase [Gammaproteobacteria bacterium]NIV19621.1 glutamate--tRNA ligase [Gammaproteobacteria bacterium]NIX10841.1 glutamate--tRNA ligase [Gammaproteobacteria bacterium]
MASTVKTRFAPSPTGRLHLGNVRTALFNWLLARSHGGAFLLRFEDTDLERSALEHEPGMVRDLQWLGLQWQEGPQVGGSGGPYRQSERIEIYNRHFAELEHKGLVYPCFCTPEALKASRKAQLAAGRPPRYPGTCAGLSAEEVAARRTEGLASTLRFRVPRERTAVFDDLVRGPQHFACDDIGDFIVRRSDGTPAFFFSNAVDDALMGVTHVLRGEDHLTNTPRQVLLLEALGLAVPAYGHTAMLVAAGGGPLSKRHGSRTVAELREQGYLPQALVNYLARLGHHYEQEGWMGTQALVEGFSLQRLGRAPSRYEDVQLRHWQREAVRRAGGDSLWEWARGHEHGIEALVPAGRGTELMRTIRDNITLPADVADWAARLFGNVPRRTAEAEQAVRKAGAGFFDIALECLDDGAEDFRDYAARLGERAGVKGKRLFMPLRAALTGEMSGPELADLWPLLGTERVRGRVAEAAAACRS